jgi:hypothetical protein
MSADNPYQSPTELPVDATRAKSAVLIPAIVLLVLASLSIFNDLVSGVIIVIDVVRIAQLNSGREQMPLDAIVMLTFFVAACVLYFLSHVLVFYGAIQMLRFRSPGIARAAAIVAVIPICSPLYVLGIPFGIWALIVLSKPEVQAAFERRATQQ